MSNKRIILNNRILGSSTKIMKIFFFILLTILLLFQSAWAGTAIIRLAWDPNQEADLAGYKIYFGTSPSTGTDPKACGTCGYSTMIDVGNVTTYRIPGLVQRQTYYISATAYDTSGNESVFSDQVSGPAKEVYINFDGDGKTDIAVYRSSNSWWIIVPSSGASPYAVAWGATGDIPVPGDYDKDGKTDIAVYRPSNGWWMIVPSSNPSAPYAVGWGASSDIPLPGDYDGDGKTDIAVYRSSNGWWIIVPSSGAAPYAVAWGASSDILVPGDYDKDGKTDIAVYRPSNGWWMIVPSSNPSAPYAVGWGASSDIPVPGDYDGDGKTDIAVYRPSNGWWMIVPSSNPSAPYAVGWGASSDIPVPGDYDGDGKTDIAVYRPSNGWWIIVPSSNPSAPYAVGWGASSDIPVTTNIGTQFSAGGYAGNLIDDNFDDGNLAGWTTSGTPTASTDQAHNGTYSAKFDAQENISRTVTGSSELYLAAWLYTGDATPSASNEIFQIWAGATSAGKLYIESDGTLAFWNDIGGNYLAAGSTALADSTWTHIELRIKKGNPTGEIQIWINEAQQVNDASQNLGTSNWDKVTFGSLNRSPNSAIYLDEIKVDNAGRIGSSP